MHNYGYSYYSDPHMTFSLSVTSTDITLCAHCAWVSEVGEGSSDKLSTGLLAFSLLRPPHHEDIAPLAAPRPPATALPVLLTTAVTLSSL